MTNRSRTDFTNLINEAHAGPDASGKRGGFGGKIRTKIFDKLPATEGEGDALTREEAEAAVLMLQAASAASTAAGETIPLGARAQLIRSALQPLAGFQISEGLRTLPDIVESIRSTNVWTSCLRLTLSYCGKNIRTGVLRPIPRRLHIFPESGLAGASFQAEITLSNLHIL